MTKVATFEKRIQAQFALLNGRPRALSGLKVSSLSSALIRHVPGSNQTVSVPKDIPKLFVTASVDMWQRAVGSFLISSALTTSSPLWSAICGYYSSHYVTRAFAHLFGCYLLYTSKWAVELGFSHGTYQCEFQKKSRADGEHKFYRRRLASYPVIGQELLFKIPTRKPTTEIDHRNKANYADHLHALYKDFTPLDRQATLRRIDQISKIEFNAPPIPDVDAFNDLENVQIIAYLRIVRYRQYLDELLKGTSGFWATNRTPEFASSFLNYQVTKSELLLRTI